MTATQPRGGVRVQVVLVALAVTVSTSACGDGTDTARRAPARLIAAVEDLADSTGGGISVAVIRGGGDTELVSAGDASRDSSRAVDGATSFRVASVTKTYLATTTLMLVDDGRLALDASLGSLFDEPGDWGDVTVRQLLGHTSGLPRSGPRLDPTTWRNPADIRLDPLCAPGTCRNYADENYVVAGLVIERVTGSPLERALRDRILTPLGLHRTFLEPAEQATPPIAEHPARPVWKPLPGVVTNAEDLARFGRALFGGDLLSDGSLRAMLDFAATGDLPCADDCEMPPRYGLGVIGYADLLPCEVWGHDGSTGAFLAYVQSTETVIAVVTNVEPWPEDFGPSIVAAATDGACA